MKAIILVSSLFYLLGLKISGQNETIKKDTLSQPVVFINNELPLANNNCLLFPNTLISEDELSYDTLNHFTIPGITLPSNAYKSTQTN